MRRWLPVVSILVLILVLTAACGGDDDDGGDTPAATATTAQAAATPTTGGGDGGGGKGDAAAGQAIAQAQCFTCHSIDGSTLVGPSWKGAYGHEVTLEDGSTFMVDADYIRESILDPNAKIVKGFPAAMPTFNGVLSDQQIDDLIAYIRSLQ